MEYFDTTDTDKLNRAPLALLYFNVLIIATCGLIYELLAGTLASYVLGDSITQFSFIIGVYLSALGVGAWLSSFIKGDLARVFIEVELGVALLGGTSAPLLFLSFARLAWFHPVLYGVVFGIGVLVGLELPLLMRILKDHLDFGDLISRVLAFDYIGALVASLMFPIFLVPRLGLVRTSLAFGLCNAAVGLWGTRLLKPILKGSARGLQWRAVLVMAVLILGLIKADSLTTLAEDRLFTNPIVYTETSHYQRIVMTQDDAGFQLFLNGNLQFNSSDEYRYHESLVHPAFSLVSQPRRILILGGGDGLAVREILRYPGIESVTIVDIDPAMTGLSSAFPPLARLNGNSLKDPRVQIVNDDAMIWIESVREIFDIAIVDFPDPNTFALGKLYTTRFFRLLRQRLSDNSIVAMQCTSPLMARRSYWCIIKTLESAGFRTAPYHATVPSFGEWGFVLASPTDISIPRTLSNDVRPQLRFLTSDLLPLLFELPRDMQSVEVEINRLDNQALVRYYETDLGLRTFE